MKDRLKTIAGTLAVSTIAATAVAQESAFPRMAPDHMRRAAPALAEYTDAVLFGDVWRRTDLSLRDRSLIVVSALIAGGKDAQLRGHAGRALDNGVTPVELSEIITHLGFYSGWPNAVSASAVVDEVFAARKIALAGESGAKITLDPDSEASRAAGVTANVGPYSPGLAEDTNEVLFGDLWRRPELSPRDRSLVTVTALIAMGQPDQLRYHLGRAMDAGLTAEQAGAVVSHLAYYVGWPRAFSAVPVLKALVDARRG